MKKVIGETLTRWNWVFVPKSKRWRDTLLFEKGNKELFRIQQGGIIYVKRN